MPKTFESQQLEFVKLESLSYCSFTQGNYNYFYFDKLVVMVLIQILDSINETNALLLQNKQRN